MSQIAETGHRWEQSWVSYVASSWGDAAYHRGALSGIDNRDCPPDHYTPAPLLLSNRDVQRVLRPRPPCSALRSPFLAPAIHGRSYSTRGSPLTAPWATGLEGQVPTRVVLRSADARSDLKSRSSGFTGSPRGIILRGQVPLFVQGVLGGGEDPALGFQKIALDRCSMRAGVVGWCIPDGYTRFEIPPTLRVG